jgi:hypothetical protein
LRQVPRRHIVDQKQKGLLNTLVAGETAPYRCVSVGEQHRDANQPSFLVVFVPLKHNRLAQILDEVPAEAIAAITPAYKTATQRTQCIIEESLAEFFVQRFGGSSYALDVNDHQRTYKLISRLHREYALEAGYNFEIALTGTKMQAVAAAMFAATAVPSSVYYSWPKMFVPAKFPRGTGATRMIHLKRTPKG